MLSTGCKRREFPLQIIYGESKKKPFLEGLQRSAGNGFVIIGEVGFQISSRERRFLLVAPWNCLGEKPVSFLNCLLKAGSEE